MHLARALFLHFCVSVRMPALLSTQLEAAPFSQEDSSWLALETVLGEQQVRSTPRVKHFMRVCSVALAVFDSLRLRGL